MAGENRSTIVVKISAELRAWSQATATEVVGAIVGATLVGFDH
jgi:hypothetical protein